VVAIPPCGLKLALDMLYQFPTQEWPQRERLIFDTKGEISTFVRRVAPLHRKLAVFSPLLRIHTSFIPSS